MKLRVPPLLAHGVALGWTSTWRLLRLNEHRAQQAQRMHPQGAVLGTFWHQSLLMAAACHHHRHVAALTSRSHDGSIMSAHLNGIGIRTVRGSSRRGGTEAARELMRAVEEGWMIATACDGPIGPIFRPKSGPIEIARRHRVPLIPMGFGASGWWDIAPAWDRFRLPWLGARVACAYGEPVMYPPEAPDAAELARRVDDLAERLWAAQREAMAALGRTDQPPR
jgi:lysophospholipid acyltransferase (LPLAT)-like uncharacterized protein